MPLSKARDRERKRLGKLELARLEKAISPPQTSNPVQPNGYDGNGDPVHYYISGGVRDIDADGNEIPDYE